MEKTVNFKQLGGYENTFFYGQAVSAVCFYMVLQQYWLKYQFLSDTVDYFLVLLCLCAIFYINLISFFHLIGNPLVRTSGAIGWFKVEVRSKYSRLSSLLYLGFLLFFNPFVFPDLNEFQLFSIGIIGFSLNVYEFIKWFRRRNKRSREAEEYKNKRKKKKELIIQLINNSDWTALSEQYKTMDYEDLMHILIHCKGPDYVAENYQQLMKVWEFHTDWSKFRDEEEYYNYCSSQYKKVMEPSYTRDTGFLN